MHIVPGVHIIAHYIRQNLICWVNINFVKESSSV
jgi:hypothetical protein